MSVVYTVKKGDCLSSIAKDHGFADWHRIYDAPENAAFKQERPNPDLIFPGDVLQIPDVASAPVAVGTGEGHVIEVAEPAARIRITLEIDEPYKYELNVAGQTVDGQTDGKSPIEQPIAADLAEASLTVWPASGDRTGATSWNLMLGDLDPIEELSGVQGRLANLGYYSGPIDGRQGPESDYAIQYFQDDEQLGTGDGLNDETRARLRKRHDGL